MVTLNKKDDGDILYAANLNDNNNFLLVSALNSLLDGATDTSQDNYFSDFFAATTNVDITNSTCLWGPIQIGKDPAFCDVYDDMTSGTPDETTRYTRSGTSTLTEPSDYLQHQTNSSSSVNGQILTDGGSGGTNPLDAKAFTDDSEIILGMRYTFSTPSGAGAGVASFRISNGSTAVNMFTVSVGASSAATADYHVRLVFDKGAETVDVYLNGTLSNNNIDISSVTTNWYLNWFNSSVGDGGNGLSRWDVFGIGHADGTVGSSTLILTNTASTSTNLAIGAVTYDGTPATPVINLSTDSGVSFDADDMNKTLAVNSSAGTALQYKITGTHVTTFDATAKNTQVLTGFTTYHG